MQSVKIDETFFEGAISFVPNAEGLQPCRFLSCEQRLYNDDFIGRAVGGAGVRLRFSSNTTSLVLKASFIPIVEKQIFIDLVIDDELVQSLPVGTDDKELVFSSLPDEEKTIEIWLSQSGINVVKSLEIDDGASFSPSPDRRKKWITYGSSITHCNDAHSPSRTWPGTVSRALGLNLTCLGFGGQCHLDPLVARDIREREADFISLKVGINVYGGGSLNPRTFKSNLMAFVRIIREKHPDTPIALVSPIISPPREKEKNNVDFTLEEMRLEVKDACVRLKECGDENIYYFDGLEVFGADLVETNLPDQLHPDGDGYEAMGRNFLRVVCEPLSQKYPFLKGKTVNA